MRDNSLSDVVCMKNNCLSGVYTCLKQAHAISIEQQNII